MSGPGRIAQSKTDIGIIDRQLASIELSGVVNSVLSSSNRNPEQIQALVSLYREIGVENPVESMLLSQMVSVHKHAMKLMAQANEISSATTSEAIMNMVNKLMRTFTSQVEAFEKLKRGGRQVIKVDHVHVHEGGQAIVGNIKHPSMGGYSL